MCCVVILRLVERFLPTQGELVPALQGIPLGNHHQEEPVTTSLSDSILLFAAPKQKVSHSRRRLRQTHKWMKNDNSVYRCPTCNAFKKRHIALHCARKEEICGLGVFGFCIVWVTVLLHMFLPFEWQPRAILSCRLFCSWLSCRSRHARVQHALRRKTQGNALHYSPIPQQHARRVVGRIR